MRWLLVVHVLACERLVETQRDLCRLHEPTRARTFVNGVFELGLELQLGLVLPYLVAGVDTRGLPGFAGGLAFRFGGHHSK